MMSGYGGWMGGGGMWAWSVIGVLGVGLLVVLVARMSRK